MEDDFNVTKWNLYADETALYFPSKHQLDIMLTLRLELSIVDQWSKANKLSLDCKKTKYIISGTPFQLREQPNFRLKINNGELEQTTVFKYLGVKLDTILKFSEHIEYVINKSLQKLSVIRKSRDSISAKTALTLYK